MKIHTCACNLCRCQLLGNESGLIDGVAVQFHGPVGAETTTLKVTINPDEATAHLCNRCLKGLMALSRDLMF